MFEVKFLSLWAFKHILYEFSYIWFRFDQWNILLVFKINSYLQFMLVCLKQMLFWWYKVFFESILVVYYMMHQIIAFSW